MAGRGQRRSDGRRRRSGRGWRDGRIGAWRRRRPPGASPAGCVAGRRRRPAAIARRSVPATRLGQLGAGAREFALGHLACQHGLLVDVGEELIEFGLDALAHDRDQSGRRQLSLTRAGAGMLRMAGSFEEPR